MITSINMRQVYPLLSAQRQSVFAKRLGKSSGIRLISNTPRYLSDKDDSKSDSNNPISRSFKILGEDIKFMKKFIPLKFRSEEPKEEVTDIDNIQPKIDHPSQGFQTHCDILIIGGGGVGSSIAYWLKKKARDGLNVVVVEKDTLYRGASAAQSFHGLNQNFSLPENIQMALYGSEFIRNVKDQLGDVKVNYTPYGSLTLATEKEAEILKSTTKLQNELGVRNEMLSKEKLQSKFPWLNTENIVLGSHGLEQQGWFDPLALLFGFKNKARDYGTHFIEGEVVDFEFCHQSDILIGGEDAKSYEALDKAVVRMPDGENRTIKFAICVIAAGSSSGKISKLARIGCGPGLLTIPVPVEQRRRQSFIINSQENPIPTFSTPLTVDPNGTFFRREGLSGNYLCGRNSSDMNVQDVENAQSIFDNAILPTLANRVNAFKSARVQKSWSDLYEYNTFDENGIIGTHPYYNNLYLAAGFNAYGIQMSPAVGRALSELIIDGRYRTIDLDRLTFDRLVVNQPLHEVSNAL